MLKNGANPGELDFEMKIPRDNVLISHKWPSRRHIPLPKRILEMLESFPKTKNE